MSTIASPRPSITLSSRRTSTSTDTTTRSTSAHRPNGSAAGSTAGSLRRNRAALRDYYGLKVAEPASDSADTISGPVLDQQEESELDRTSFDPEAYVQGLLSREGLEGVLKVEAGVVSEIRSLDGEKKALVYDNYSKLIAATDTIRSMREKMDPISPTTSNLQEDIGRIAETAANLSEELRRHYGSSNGVTLDDQEETRMKQRQTVRWALDAPGRMKTMVASGRSAEAEELWRGVSALLVRWEGVKGVQELRQTCIGILKSHE